jgi:hypothetical protein
VFVSGFVTAWKYEVGTGTCCCHDVMPAITFGICTGSGIESDSS